MTAPTLSAFLLARLTDQAAAISLTKCEQCLTYQHAPGMPAAERLLDDVTARRRIVDLHSGGHECVGDGQFWWDDGDEWTQACPTLRLVGAAYADHPDFDESWRA